MSDLARSQSLSCIPKKKLQEALLQTIKSCSTCSESKLDSNLCSKCRVINKAIHRYAESNIPVIYWPLEMDHNFYGDPVLKEKYEFITSNIPQAYSKGTAICFAGGHGKGKTLAITNILKRSVESGYTALYVNLSDIVNVTLAKDTDDRFLARKELLMVDFLAIDEFDPRYMPNDKSSDLFGKVLEEIFRTRHQNALPTFMATNSPNVIESFQGNIKASIESLMSTVEIVPVLGKDFRKELSKKAK